MAKVTEREAAKQLGKSRAALQDARKRGDLVRALSRDGRGRLLVDLEVAREELKESAVLKMGARGGADETLQRWRTARARLAEAHATREEDELRRRRGELVETKEVEVRWTTIIMNCKTKLLAIPSRVKQQLPHLSVADVATIDDLVREALEDLAGGRRRS